MGRAEVQPPAGALGPLLEEGAALLREAGLPRARQDAEWLLEGLSGLQRWRLSLEPDRPVAREVAERFLKLVHRRRGLEPLQYLLGREEFGGLRFHVTPAATIPRPETELLVRWALELLAPQKSAVDLGTGSGAIALALAAAVPDLTLYAVDNAPAAVALALDNAAVLGLLHRVQFFEGDLFAPLAFLTGAVDLIVSNPPYIPSGALQELPREVREYEPLEALDGGPDGTAVHWRIIAEAPRFLSPGGWLLMEMGEGHAGPLSQLLKQTGFQDVEVRKDLCGVDRMIGARWEGWGAQGGREVVVNGGVARD